MIRRAGFTPSGDRSAADAGYKPEAPSPQVGGAKRAQRGTGHPRWGDALGAVAALAVLGSFAASPAAAVPCGKHKGDKLAACKSARAKQAYPKSPTFGEALARLSDYEERSLLAIGRCEMGTRAPGYTKARRGWPKASSPWARLRWGLDYSRYSTAFGIWNGNGAYIRRATGGYSFPGRTPAEELLGAKALADGPARGFSGWACHGRS